MMKFNSEKKSDIQEVTIFRGSSPEDVEHAKSFWKSLTLQPPLESRLVSAEIRQRLRVAPPPSRTKKNRQIFIQKEKQQKELEERFKEIEKMEHRERYEKLARKREAALELLYKQRTQRLEKEMIRNKVIN